MDRLANALRCRAVHAEDPCSPAPDLLAASLDTTSSAHPESAAGLTGGVWLPFPDAALDGQANPPCNLRVRC